MPLQIDIELAALLNALSFESSYTVRISVLFHPWSFRLIPCLQAVPSTSAITMMSDDDRGYHVRRLATSIAHPDLTSIAVRFLRRFRTLSTHRAAHTLSMPTHAKLRISPWHQ